MIEPEINAIVAKLTYMVNGIVGRDWRSGQGFVTIDKGNEVDAIRDALRVIHQLRPHLQEGWQPPETQPGNGMYLVANAAGQVCPVQCRDGFPVVQNMPGFADWDFGSTVTAWRPLPEAPK